MSKIEDKLIEITSSLGKADETQKSSKKDRDRYKDEFFETANDVLASRDLAQKTYSIVKDIKNPEEFASNRNPGWIVINISKTSEGYSVLLEEDPSFMPFVFVNQNDKKVYNRSIREGSLLLDDDLLKEEDPDLYDEVTQTPNADIIWDFLNEFDDSGLDDSLIQYIDDNPNKFPRILKSLDDLTESQIDDLQPYMYQGPKTVALNAPRKAKPEELN